MATCGSLQHIFDSMLPVENPTLLESLSRSQLKPIKTIEQTPSFTEIFGELHFKESPISPPPSSSSHLSTTSSSPSTEIIINQTNLNKNEEDSVSSDTSQTPLSPSASFITTTPITSHTSRHKSSGSFSWLSSETLHLCTEGLGFESSDDVEDSKSGMSEYWPDDVKDSKGVKENLSSRDSYGECRRTRASEREYPPPLSSIGRTGKSKVFFKSYRIDGRFVLKEISIPTQEVLHAYREDGRLKLQFVHPHEDDDQLLEEDEDDDIGSIDEEEETMGKEDDDCDTHHAIEGKETDTVPNYDPQPQLIP